MGVAPAAPELSLDVHFEAKCPEDGIILLRPVGDAVIVVQYRAASEREISGSTPSRIIGAIDRPWAVDETGAQLPTRFELEGSTLRQRVDASKATGTVWFDPTYNNTNCEGGHWADLNATQYLDMFGSTDNRYYCPPTVWFMAAKGYFPQAGFEDLLAQYYGWVLVTPTSAGDACSPPAVETGTSFDFWVPCQAHDYCYDLRGAGFAGVVTDSACDDAFSALMDAHCEGRSILLRPDCFFWSDTYSSAVRLPNVVTNPNPPTLRFRPTHWLFNCMDVQNGSRAMNTLIQQWGCNTTDAQYFRPIQNANGTFLLLRPATYPSDDCAALLPTAYGWFVAQRSCYATAPPYAVPDAQKTFRIEGWWGTDTFQFIAPQSNWCLSVPNSSWSQGQVLMDLPCTGGANQIWDMVV